MNIKATQEQKKQVSSKIIIPKIQWKTREEMFWHSRGMQFTRIKNQRQETFQISISFIGRQFNLTFFSISSTTVHNQKYPGSAVARFNVPQTQKFVISFETQNDSNITTLSLNQDEMAEVQFQYFNQSSYAFRSVCTKNGSIVNQKNFSKTFTHNITQKIPWISIHRFLDKSYEIWKWPGQNRYTLLHIWLVQNIFKNWDQDLIREISLLISAT